MRTLWASTFACLALAGCGSDNAAPSPQQPATDGGLEAQAEASPESSPDAPMLTSWTITVQTLAADGKTTAPASGALVALDPPTGARVEKTTGADGKVTFEFEAKAGKSAVTAYLAGYAMLSWVDVSDARIAELASTPMILPALPLQAEPMIDVTGTFTGTAPEQPHLTAVTTAQARKSSQWYGCGTNRFGVIASAGAPFVVQAIDGRSVNFVAEQGYDLEINQLAELSVAASASDVTGLVIDFAANKVQTSTADVTFDIPTRQYCPLGTAISSQCVVFDRNFPTSGSGWTTYTRMRADKTGFDHEVTWYEPTWSDPYLQCTVTAPDGASSWIQVDGYPVAGKLPAALLDVPTWLTPADTTVAQSLHGNWTWTANETGLTESALQILKNGVAVWTVSMPPEDTSVIVPKAPTGVNESQWIGAAATVVLSGNAASADKSVSRFYRSIAMLASADDAVAKTPDLVAPQFDTTKIQADMDYLAGAETQGRAIGTAGNVKAVEYLEKAFADIGLEPAGDAAGSYRQAFPFTLWEQTEPPVVVVGGTTWASGLDFNSVRFSGSADLTAEVVFVGTGIVVPPFDAARFPKCGLSSSGYDDFAGVDVTGKIILARLSSPGGIPLDGCPLETGGDFILTALARGAAGAIIMLAPPMDYAVRGLNLFEAMGSTDFPVIIARSASAKVSFNGLSAWMFDMDKNLTPHPVATGITANIKVAGKVTPVTSYNVIGKLPGNDAVIGNETVIVSGHLDGLGADEQSGKLYAGMNDNVTGTVAAVRIAEEMVKRIGTPKRTVLFAEWNGEETGLLGSCYYASSPLQAPFNLAGVVNLEMMNSGDPTTMAMTGSNVPVVGWMHELMKASTQKLSVTTNLQIWASGADSDHWCFSQQGIPAVTMRGGGAAGAYHSTGDGLANFNMAEMVQQMTVSWALVTALAQGLEHSLPVSSQSQHTSSARPRLALPHGIWLSQ